MTSTLISLDLPLDWQSNFIFALPVGAVILSSHVCPHLLPPGSSPVSAVLPSEWLVGG